MMHVLILSTMYPNSKIYLSGIFVHEQVKALISAGIKVTVFAPVPFTPKILSWFSDKWKGYRDIPNMETIDNIIVYHPRYFAIPKGLFKQYWSYPYTFFLKKLLKKRNNKEKIDLIHAHGSSPTDHAAYLLSKRLAIPYLITVHGDTVYELVKNQRKFINAKKALFYANAIIAVSSQVKKRIIKYVSRRENIFIIYNGFDPSEDIVAKAEKVNNKFMILFVATLIERKGCEYVLKGFKKIYNKYPNTFLVIVGGGKLFNKMKSLSNTIGIGDRIYFTGVLNHGEVMKYMDKCDIFILPSWDEAFGVVYLEAMSRKKPIIATEGEGITDIVKNGVEALLVKPKDSDSIAEKLSLLIYNSKLRTEIGLKGYEKIKNLTWFENANKTIEIYKKILGKESQSIEIR